ncbi:substrate-binding periplasmic protein [Halopseudomonas salina]|uniref:ABC transporter n=1 Tax=Halopseudomonas salina TaxID=1323744 RepID=A0ABQ1P1H3_9GAMM|nr:transporter substrate-binding domain-containing protein [Halopseudomonas salina]GGC89309.1 ABC transporter [Halopseudomonas salina]
MKTKLVQLIAASVFSALSSSAVADTLKLTSLHWPPYAGPELQGQGASVAVAKAALEAMGHTLEVDFFPWSRAVALTKKDDSYIGYFPEYLYESIEFVFSDPLGTGPLGLVERSSNPVEWENPGDLKGYRLGVVQDYVNTEQIDAMIASGDIEASTVTADTQNILKVAAGRIDVAVIDSNVFDYLLANNPQVSRVRNTVQMNDRLLVEKNLHIAFKNNAEGRKWKAIFDEGLQKIDVQGILEASM